MENKKSTNFLNGNNKTQFCNLFFKEKGNRGGPIAKERNIETNKRTYATANTSVCPRSLVYCFERTRFKNLYHASDCSFVLAPCLPDTRKPAMFLFQSNDKIEDCNSIVAKEPISVKR